MINNIEQFFKPYKGTPRGKNSSVHFSEYRLNKAKKQIENIPVPIDTVIKYVNDFLINIGILTIENPILYIDNVSDINYIDIQKKYRLSDERDIIWMKFTLDGYLGVVAKSNDINFNIPLDSSVYHERVGNSDWKYTTSGILIHQLSKAWDTSFVLIFPLRDIPKGYKAGDIEMAIGNYLIYKDVPIIDFYSHNY